MLVKKRPHKFKDVRTALQYEGEVEFGAAARRRWWRRAWLAAVGLGLIAGAVGLYRLGPSARDGQIPAAPGVKVKCTNPNCRYVEVIAAKTGQVFPLVCPKCGQHTWYQVWRCRRCKREFVPLPDGAPVRCPNCGSPAVGAAYTAGR